VNPSIFINYRRDDASAESLLVKKALLEQFGEENVFMDVTSIDPGAAWPREIEMRLKKAAAVVAVIGPNWLRAGSDEWGRRRIDRKSDWVRKELEVVLRRRQKLIPLYVRDAKAFPPDVLPPSIRRLSKIQGIPIRRDSWEHDIQRLLANLAATETRAGKSVKLTNPYPVSKLTPPDRLSATKLGRVLRSELPYWTAVRSQLLDKPRVTREELFREFVFRKFADAIRFMEQVAAGCDSGNHHPRWENIFKVLRVYLSTWDGGLHRISDRDVQLAQYFDRAYKTFPGAARLKPTGGGKRRRK